MPHMHPYPSVEEQQSRQRKIRIIKYTCWFSALFINLVIAVAYLQNLV